MRIFVILAAFLILTSHSPAVRAEEAAGSLPVVFKGRYSFSWSGIPIGSAKAVIQQDTESYESRAVTKSTGVVSWFVKHVADSKVEGMRLSERYKPRHYHTDYTLRKKSSSIKMTYDASGDIGTITLLPPRPANDRPAIATEELRNSLDPLTTFVVLDDMVKTARKEGKPSISFDMFDGKRLSRMTLTLKGNDQAMLRRTPLGGFKDKELRKAKKEPEVNLYFNEKLPVPSRVAIEIYGGTLAGVLKEHCVGVEACKAY